MHAYWICSIVKDIEEALVKFLLPELTFGSDTNDDQALIGTRVNIHEFTVLRLEISSSRAFRILFSLVKLVGYSHIHLNLDSSQMHLIIFISYHEVLVAIMPEKRVSLDLNELVGRCGRISISVVLETFEMIELDWNDGAWLGVLDLKGTVLNADLEPVISIELRDQVTSLIT